MTKLLSATLAVALASISGAADAQTIAASDPQAMAAAMRNAGFAVELDTDKTGDPRIRTKLSGYDSEILFYDCDEASHDGCESVQFSTGFDRNQAMTAAEAIDLARKYRFISIHLDDEGDPFLQWDVITGEGIPSSVFFSALRRYAEVVDEAGDIVFEND